MADAEIRKLLHEALVHLQSTPVDDRDQYNGICSAVFCYVREKLRDQLPTPRDQLLSRADQMLTDMFKLWPQGTGMAGYPVPDPDGGWAGAIYTNASSFGEIWRGRYGALRMQLLAWCIEQTKET